MASLKIQLKTLKNQKYDLDVTEAMTVKDVKGLCDTKLQLGAPDTQRLIHAGKILKDEQTIGECKIKENDIVVIMTSKAKAAAPAPATATASATSPAASGAAAATPAKPEEAAKPAAATPAAAASTGAAAASPAKPAAGGAAKDEGKTTKASADASSQLVMGENYNTMIANLMGLGFTHDKVVKALQAAFNNPDRAVEYLFNPAAMEAALRSAGGAAAAGGGGAGGAGGAGQGGAQQQAGSSNAGQPAQAQGAAQGGQGGAQAGQAMAAELNQLRAIMQQQPQFIPLLLQQIAQSDPQLAAAVQQNPDAFVRLLQNPQLAGQLLAAAAAGGAGAAGGGGGGAGGQGAGLANQPRAVTVQLTAEEKKSIDNLVRLGFSQNKAIEAFILCDRKEDVAANYLFENRNEGADEDY